MIKILSIGQQMREAVAEVTEFVNEHCPPGAFDGNLTLGKLLDVKTMLATRPTQSLPDGTYAVLLGYRGMRDLFSDTQFLCAYASRYRSSEYQGGQEFDLLGMSFSPWQELDAAKKDCAEPEIAYMFGADHALGLKYGFVK